MATQPIIGSGGVPTSSDVLNPTTGLNGGVPDVANEQVLRAKMGFGLDGFFQDVNSANPMPATLAAETTKVIGTVNIAAAQNISPFDVQMSQSASITPLRELSIAIKARIFGDSFADGVGVGEDAGTFPATPTVTGTASGATVGGAFVVSTGATLGSTGNMTSLLVNSFITGSVGLFQAGVLLPSVSLTGFRVVSRKASVDTGVDSAAFNVVTGTAPANGLFNRFEIWYQGNGAIFTVNGLAIHRMPGTVSTPRTTTLNFPLAVTWTNAVGPVATLRVGAFTSSEGYFFEATYNIADVTAQIRGITASRVGAAEAYHQIADTTGLTAAESYGSFQLGWDEGGTPGWRRQRVGSKGVQQAFSTMTQDMKDSGRNPVHFYTVIPVLSAAVDTLLALTGTKSGATVVATTTPAVVTAGKNFRITRVTASYFATLVSGYAVVRVRFNPAGLVAITSPVAATIAVGSSSPTTINAAASVEAALDDGWEFAAGTGIGISAQGFTEGIAAIVGYVLVSVTGFEY